LYESRPDDSPEQIFFLGLERKNIISSAMCDAIMIKNSALEIGTSPS
jgi:hypothetical protein